MSTELAVPPILLDPQTGQALEVNPENAAVVLHRIKDLYALIRDAKEMATHVLLDEMRRQGLKTMNVGGLKVEQRTSKEIHWNLELLEELRKAGLPEERYNDLVRETVSYHVNANEAKRIAAANDTYRSIIEAARTDHERTPTISVTS